MYFLTLFYCLLCTEMCEMITMCVRKYLQLIRKKKSILDKKIYEVLNKKLETANSELSLLLERKCPFRDDQCYLFMTKMSSYEILIIS